MKKFALFLTAALVVFVALAQSESPSVEETISTLQEGVTNIPLEAALANISSWQETLEASDDAALRIIGVQLGDLVVALETDPINKQEVGRMLITLGKGTVVIGEDRGDDQVVALGDMLTQAGTSVYVEAEEGNAGNMSGGGN
jgi:hypothetical protein